MKFAQAWKPATAVEKVFAAAALKREKEEALGHIPYFAIAEDKSQQWRLRAQAKADGFVNLKEASVLMDCTPGTALYWSKDWTKREVGARTMYARQDVLATAEKRKQMRK